MPGVTVVVCTYTADRWSQTAAALESLLAQTSPPDQVIVAVDHNPELLDRMRSTYPWATVVPNEQKKGLSGARNTGLAHASQPYVAFLDDDAVAEAHWLAALSRLLDDGRVLGVGGRIEPAWEAQRPSWFPPEFDWVIGCTYEGHPRSTGPVRNMLGASMLFRGDVLRAVGGFRSELGRLRTVPLGCEETEVCLRVARTFGKGRIWYEPSAIVRHHVPVRRGRFQYFRSRCWAEGKSKAVVATMAGPTAALSSERDYVTRVLTRGMVHGVRQLITARDAAGALRSAVILTGLLCTAAGYLTERLYPKAKFAAPIEPIGVTDLSP